MAKKSAVPEDEEKREIDVPGAPELPHKSGRKSDSSGDNAKSDDSAFEQDEQPENNEPTELDSEKTDEAVEDIVRNESDELLSSQDKAVLPGVEKSKKQHWWHRGWFVWTLVFLLLVGGVAAALIPASRYFILNTAGVRVRASVHVADSTTSQPLKNVTVSIGGISAETDEKGNATLTGLKQGPQKLVIERVAFAKFEKQVVLGWGSNPLGLFKISPAGAQYTFYVRDFLSKKPIEGAEVSSGRLSAVADNEGKAVLTIQNTDRDEVPITVSADGYRSDNSTLPVDTDGDVELLMVPSNKAVFVAQAQGRYNVYSMYADGKDRKVLLAGTGRENSDISLAVSQDGQVVALASVRENIKAEDGTLLQSLTIINVGNGKAEVIDRALKVELIDWVGGNLAYQMTMPGLAQNDPQRQRLMSYNASGNKRTQLAAAATFESVASAQGQLYYSAAGGTFNNLSPAGDTKEETVLEETVAAAYRTDYNTLILRTADGWYSLSLNSGTTAKTGTPDDTDNRIYVSDASGDRNLWVDGSALMLYDTTSGQDTRIYSQSSLSYPVRWLNPTTAIYRAGSTDYAVSTEGGEPRKITLVTTTAGLIQTY